MTMVTTSAPVVAAALSPYGTLQGSLFQYHRNLVAFESSPPYTESSPSSEAACKCILIGGLSDGLLPTPYTESLQNACHELGWSLVQPIMGSSYTGFGNGSLERDSTELQHLLRYLSEHRSGELFGLVGHSTGCQNAVHLLKNGSPELISKLKVIALQAPVSDREGAMTEADYEKNIKIARQLVADKKEQEMMPRGAFWAPITAQRFMDLQSKGGADDFFSSDYTDEELQERLGHVGTYESEGLHVLAAFSGADEYVPKHVDRRLLTERLCNAMNVHCVERKVATPLYITSGNHNLSKAGGDADAFVDRVKDLFNRVSQ